MNKSVVIVVEPSPTVTLLVAVGKKCDGLEDRNRKKQNETVFVFDEMVWVQRFSLKTWGTLRNELRIIESWGVQTITQTTPSDRLKLGRGSGSVSDKKHDGLRRSPWKTTCEGRGLSRYITN